MAAIAPGLGRDIEGDRLPQSLTLDDGWPSIGIAWSEGLIQHDGSLPSNHCDRTVRSTGKDEDIHRFVESDQAWAQRR